MARKKPGPWSGSLRPVGLLVGDQAVHRRLDHLHAGPAVHPLGEHRAGGVDHEGRGLALGEAAAVPGGAAEHLAELLGGVGRHELAIVGAGRDRLQRLGVVLVRVSEENSPWVGSSAAPPGFNPMNAAVAPVRTCRGL